MQNQGLEPPYQGVHHRHLSRSDDVARHAEQAYQIRERVVEMNRHAQVQAQQAQVQAQAQHDHHRYNSQQHDPHYSARSASFSHREQQEAPLSDIQLAQQQQQQREQNRQQEAHWREGQLLVMREEETRRAEIRRQQQHQQQQQHMYGRNDTRTPPQYGGLYGPPQPQGQGRRYDDRRP
ncbi:hypothetical protein B0A49_08467 [Cryomyces minteri]|uniref:Uncharacterized protein n=1 Tax=Cryomyces minteri TaxID=331657 RepID=A0A4U0WJJ7_9PEZI|nr:hypothetical protein B0A49_08467 [Cryomyces minteri]